MRGQTQPPSPRFRDQGSVGPLGRPLLSSVTGPKTVPHPPGEDAPSLTPVSLLSDSGLTHIGPTIRVSEVTAPSMSGEGSEAETPSPEAYNKQ